MPSLKCDGTVWRGVSKVRAKDQREALARVQPVRREVLDFAVEWLESYEGEGDGDEAAQLAQEAVEWLRAAQETHELGRMLIANGLPNNASMRERARRQVLAIRKKDIEQRGGQ